MPELPEVETTRRGISPHLLGRKVLSVLVREPRLRWPVPDNLAGALTGQTVKAVNRRAKYLLFVTGRGRLMLHLGMSGSLGIARLDSPARKHDHVDVILENAILRYRDPRRFGFMFWLEGESGHTMIDDLGPEPLTDDFDGDYLFAAARGRKTPIKVFLMNAKVVAGVGNIYAGEVLFRSGINPCREAGRISRARYRTLAGHLKAVLDQAIRSGGTTLRDFVRENGSPGYFRQSLDVYGRGGEPCNRCGRPLKSIRLNQRATVYCTGCQR